MCVCVCVCMFVCMCVYVIIHLWTKLYMCVEHDHITTYVHNSTTIQAREYCCLGHILSLWETISVELAKQLYLAEQVRPSLIQPDRLHLC